MKARREGPTNQRRTRFEKKWIKSEDKSTFLLPQVPPLSRLQSCEVRFIVSRRKNACKTLNAFKIGRRVPNILAVDGCLAQPLQNYGLCANTQTVEEEMPTPRFLRMAPSVPVPSLTDGMHTGLGNVCPARGC